MTTLGKLKKGDALRVNDRFSVEDWGLAEKLWTEAGLRGLLLGGGVGDGEGEDEKGNEKGAGAEELWYVA